MNKERMKGLFTGVLLTLFLITSTNFVFAAVANKTISVAFNNIKVFVDGIQVTLKDTEGKTVEPFIYNGTTYLPVTAIADAIGKVALWDGSSNSIYIGKHNSENPVVMLSDLDYFNSSSYKFKYYNLATDNFGNKYYNAIGGGYGYDDSWQEYAVNGKYSQLKGRVILNYERRSQTNDKAIIKIFCDGKLAYASPVITGGVEPIDFAVDLNGVLKLKVVIYGESMIRMVDCGLY